MDLIQSFSFEEIPVRTTERNGEAWFCLVDVCAVLGISNPSQAKTRLDEDEHDLISNEGQYYGIVSESGLYSLVLGSRKPEAKRFKRWVTSEVIPSIRKTGSYSIGQQVPAIPQTYAEALQLAADQAKQLEIQAPKVEYHDKVLATENGLTTTEIASELGMSAIALNKALQDMKVQRKVGGRWVLTVAYINQGYDVEVTHVDDGGKSRHAMKWTEKGRKLIHELMGE